MINATFLKIIMSIVLVLAYLLLVFNQYINRKTCRKSSLACPLSFDAGIRRFVYTIETSQCC